nr:hypothetical protein [Arthrobacter sp. TB 23]
MCISGQPHTRDPRSSSKRYLDAEQPHGARANDKSAVARLDSSALEKTLCDARKRLEEHSILTADVIWNTVQIYGRHYDIFREPAILE